uniref:Uncharacterized protein n=1 Tax=Panagrellus redivivus TaxID=6233 RepID=A0A7E4WBM6_PANRE
MNQRASHGRGASMLTPNVIDVVDMRAPNIGRKTAVSGGPSEGAFKPTTNLKVAFVSHSFCFRVFDFSIFLLDASVKRAISILPQNHSFALAVPSCPSRPLR